MTDTFLTITPLGGLGEIGMNCQMWNTPEGCVLVDCGIMFPDDQQLGVDVVIYRRGHKHYRPEDFNGAHRNGIG